MSAKRHQIQERELVGFKYFQPISRLLERLHGAGCERDRAGNRELHMDQYMTLLLLYMFSPIVVSLRALAQVSELHKVQEKLGVGRTSLGSLSEASQVFDSSLVVGLIGELADKLQLIPHDARLDGLGAILTVVDGTVLSALPKITWALWRDDEHRALKAHMEFEVLKGVPVAATITDANTSEKTVLGQRLQAGRLYVVDRGYAKYELFQQIIDLRSSFVGRIRDNAVFEVVEERELSSEALGAGLVRDAVVRLGCDQKQGDLKQPVRIVEIKCTPHLKRGHGGRGGPEQGETILLLTDRLDLPAEVIALIYQHRWVIEIFFRFFKHILGCRHLLHHSPNGIELQTYAAIIACMLIALWTGRKPTLRTYEMISYYLMGWADEDELEAHIGHLKKQAN